jgi:hypothetical protein
MATRDVIIPQGACYTGKNILGAGQYLLGAKTFAWASTSQAELSSLPVYGKAVLLYLGSVL